MKNFLKGKRVLVVGLGKSGLSAINFLVKKGAVVKATDQKSRKELSSVLKEIPRRVTVETGSDRFFSQDYDLAVVSPGVPSRHAGVQKLLKKGVPVWPELELGWRFVKPRRTVAITGTNGKTTTTALIAEILKSSGRSVVVGGNIGTPLCDLIPKISNKTNLVLEVSSYQLELQKTFHPGVGLFLNLTPDHLARHGSMAGYARAKANLFKNFTSSDTAVLNRNDVWCRRVGKKIRGKKVWFPNPSLKKLASSIRLPGEHNLENAMAAAAAARAMGVADAQIQKALAEFKGVRHRIQVAAEIDGVLYVNDSKSTNVDSTLVALKAFDRSLILILGGQDKGAPYTPLIPLIKRKVREILTIGEAHTLIARDLKGAAPIAFCKTLKKAVARAAHIARPGDVVLLSPACASFDQFKNFEHRGDVFLNLVESLER